MKNPGERRRGAALEQAVLDAAWEELAQEGFSNLTMEAVANRAKTSRPVLLRRWADRGQLAVAAIRHYLAAHPVAVPDEGTFRKQLMSYMRQNLSRGMPVVLLTTLQMSDYLRETHSQPRELRKKILSGEDSLLNLIFQRAAKRGEIDAKKLTPRIITLVPDLLRHELLMTLEPIPESLIAATIDDILLPLVRPK